MLLKLHFSYASLKIWMKKAWKRFQVLSTSGLNDWLDEEKESLQKFSIGLRFLQFISVFLLVQRVFIFFPIKFKN